MFLRGNTIKTEDEQHFWPMLIERCMKEWKDKLNEAEINDLLKNFDPDNNRYDTAHPS